MAEPFHSVAPPVPLSTVRSPCVNVCRMEATSGWCEGCLRTLDEIATWSTLDDAGKREVLRVLPTRRASRRAMRPTPPDIPTGSTGR